MAERRLTIYKIIGRVALISMFVWLVIVLILIVMIHTTGRVNHAESADVIVILGAGLNEEGHAGYALTRRATHAANLYHQGYADMIICTGGVADNQTRSEADGCFDVLVSHAVPESAILIETESASTEENALFVEPILEAHNFESIIIVSDSYHVFRARYIFQSIGIDTISLSPVSSALIRGYPTYESSVIREILALHWQVFKTIFKIPVTSL